MSWWSGCCGFSGRAGKPPRRAPLQRWPMRSNSLTLFLLLSVVGLLCLMPVWYYFLAPWLAEPVFFLAGKLV